MAISAEDRDFLVSLYVGYFNRAPDPAGLQFWIDQVEAGRDTNTIAADFAASPEAKSLYPFLTTPDVSSPTSFITAVYANLFNRAPDAAGQAFWEQQLASGAVSPADAIDAIIKGATTAPDSTILANKNTVGLDFATDAGNTPGFTFDLNGASGNAATSAISGVTEDASTVIAAQAATDAYLNGVAGVGETLTLTTGVDNITGTTNNDTITGLLSGTAANVTLNSLDQIDGGAGANDTLTVLDETGGQTFPTTLQMSNVETVVVRSAGDADIDLTAASGVTGVETLKSTQSSAATLTAGATTDIQVSGATGAINVSGGKNVTVTDGTADQDISVGEAGTGTVNPAGTITVTDSKQGTGDIAVDGGTDVSVTTTIAADATAVAGGDVTVGANTAASGTSTVVQNLTSTGGDNDADDLTGANIAVTGGTAINATVNATSTAKDESADGDIAIGTVTATAGTTTTEVSLTQNATATTFTKAAVDAVKETATVTFSAMNSGQTLTFNGLTFTAAKDLTAAEVANAFANIAEDGDYGSAGTGDGVYTGTFGSAAWSSAAANGNVVTFTAQDEDETNFTFTGNATAPTAVYTAGTAAVAADTSTNVVTHGAVTVDDNATAASLTSVTVDGYAAGSSIGGTNATTKLATLNLANAEGTADMTVADTADTLAMTVEGLGSAAGSAVVTLTAAPVTLNVTSTGNNFVDLTAAATETLIVSGTGVLDAGATDLDALKNVTVSGAAGVSLNAGVADTVESVSTTAATGTTTVTIDGTKATYSGGAGADVVSLATGTALTKAIDLGAGNDTLQFVADVAGSTAALNGGDGTDTLSMTVARAAALDASAQSFYTNFERLTLNDNVLGGATADDSAADTVTIDLANLGFTSYVTTSGTGTGADAEQDILALDKLASNGTVVLTANGLVTVNVKDAATGTSDVLNLKADVADSNINFGTLTAANVETVNLSSDDTLEDDNEDGTVSTSEAAAEDATLVLTADKATTVNVTGSADVILTMTDSTKVTTIDASGMTGALTVTSVNTTTAATITGGSGNDAITGAADQDVLIGGAGNDTLTAAGELTTLTGGAGNDTFVLNTPGSVNGYATITDLSSGDIIDTSASSFSNTQVVLGATAVFQDYANAAVNSVDSSVADAAAWFQFGGDTYLVVDDHTGGDSTSFVNGQDQIIKITGAVDLSEARFNTTDGDLAIA